MNELVEYWMEKEAKAKSFAKIVGGGALSSAAADAIVGGLFGALRRKNIGESRTKAILRDMRTGAAKGLVGGAAGSAAGQAAYQGSRRLRHSTIGKTQKTDLWKEDELGDLADHLVGAGVALQAQSKASRPVQERMQKLTEKGQREDAKKYLIDKAKKLGLIGAAGGAAGAGAYSLAGQKDRINK